MTTLSRSPTVVPQESPRSLVVEQSPRHSNKRSFSVDIPPPLTLNVKYVILFILLRRPNLGSSSAVSQVVPQQRVHVQSNAHSQVSNSQADDDEDDEDDEDVDDDEEEEDNEDNCDDVEDEDVEDQ